ncbi:tetratricopeptide repeat protein [bacterium]|nr:MAG: tetratricopeptide repeat protein [bacterium]
MKSENKSNKDADLAQVRELITQAYGLMNSDPNKCIKISKEALQLSDKHQFGVGQGMAFMHIGLGYFHQSDYYNALKNYLKAEPVFLKEKYWYGVRSIYNNIGLIYSHWDDLETALKFYHKNLKLRSKFNDPKLSSTILNNIGGIYLQLKDYEKALQYYKESLQECTIYNFPYMRAVASDNIGKIYMTLHKRAEAEQFFLQAIDLNESIENYAVLSDVYQNLAMLKKDNDEIETALSHLNKALHYSQKISEWNQMALVYQKFAQVYAAKGNKRKEKEYLDKSVAVAEPRNYRSILLDVYSSLASYYETKSQYKKALVYHKQIRQIEQFLSNEKKTRAIEEIKTRMEVERTEREKKILQHKNDELEKMNAQILKQKTRLELVEKELKELNQNLEQRVLEETEKRRLQEQVIIQKSKLESLGRLAAGIAHEINQPIGLIKIATQNLYHKFENKKITDEYLKEKSAFIDENITRINKIIEHIRLFSRDQQQGGTQKIDIVKTLENALSMIQMQFKNHNISIVKEIEQVGLETIGNKYRLEQVILNLLSNARDGLNEKFDELDDTKNIVLRLYQKKNKIVFELEDNGFGLDKQTIEHAFDPFYTTKTEAKGTGLGLSICYGIIQEMKGNISLESEKGKFTLVRIELPVCSTKS